MNAAPGSTSAGSADRATVPSPESVESPMALTTPPEKSDSPNESSLQQVKQREMKQISPEGRGPDPETGRKSWKFLYWQLVAVVLILAAGLGLLFFKMGLGSVGMALVYLVILVAAASPVWVSMLLRRGEERSANRRAITVLKWWRRDNVR